jgi:heptosyltransferase-1
MKAVPKILLIRLSSLGDILHTLPAFQDFRQSFPGAGIDWLVSAKFRFLLSVIPGIDEIITLDFDLPRSNPWSVSGWVQAVAVVRKLRAKHYDLCIDFQGLLKTALLSSLCGARTRLGFAKPLVRERPAHWFYHKTVGAPAHPSHIVALNRRLTQAAGAREFQMPCSFNPGSSDIQEVQRQLEARQLRDFVVINPGGGWHTKRWHPARFGLLARKIQADLALPVVVTTGPGEERLFDEIANQCNGVKPHHFPVPFLQLIPLLQQARLLIGGDTGPFHLACALGRPVVGIFGPTAPVRNGPWRIGEETVFHSLPCSFCYGRTCPTQEECMDIDVDEVFSAVVRRLRSEH